jgi:hypothetical protein
MPSLDLLRLQRQVGGITAGQSALPYSVDQHAGLLNRGQSLIPINPLSLAASMRWPLEHERRNESSS